MSVLGAEGAFRVLAGASNDAESDVQRKAIAEMTVLQKKRQKKKKKKKMETKNNENHKRG